MQTLVPYCHKLAAEHGVREFPGALLRLYRAFVLPHAMYGCQVWGTNYLSAQSRMGNPLQVTYTSFSGS
jgi:hypothetical protein